MNYYRGLLTMMCALMLSGTVYSQSKNLENLLNAFGDLKPEMNTPQINDHIMNSAKLDQSQCATLGETEHGGAVYHPLAKVVNGKSAILFYLSVEFSDDEKDIEVFYLHAHTINTKTAEIMEKEKYLFAGGERSGTKMNGSYKLKEKDIIQFQSNSVVVETEEETNEIKEYKLGKKLEFLGLH